MPTSSSTSNCGHTASRFARLRYGVVACLSVGLLGACEAKATPEECDTACTNIRGVFLGVVDKETAREETLKKMGTTGAELAKETAALFVDFLTRECVRQCNARSTRKVAECLSSAKSPEDVNRCYE